MRRTRSSFVSVKDVLGSQLFFDFMRSEIAAELYCDEVLSGAGELLPASRVQGPMRGDEPDEPSRPISNKERPDKGLPPLEVS